MNERGEIKRTWSETIGDNTGALFGWFGSFLPQPRADDGYELPEVEGRKVEDVNRAMREWNQRFDNAHEAARAAGKAAASGRKKRKHDAVN